MYSYKVCLLRCYPDQLPIRWFHVKGLPFVVQGKHTNKASVPNFMKIYWKLVRSNFPRNSKDATGHSIQQIWSKNPNDAFLVSHVCYSSRSFFWMSLEFQSSSCFFVTLPTTYGKLLRGSCKAVVAVPPWQLLDVWSTLRTFYSHSLGLTVEVEFRSTETCNSEKCNSCAYVTVTCSLLLLVIDMFLNRYFYLF